MRKPYISVSLHLHDAPIKLRWVEDPSAREAGGFLNFKMADVNILLFTEAEIERLVTSGAEALRLFREKKEQFNAKGS